MQEAIIEALIDSVKMLPFLFIIYLLTEYAEYRWGNKFEEKLAHARKAGPIAGALFASVPQCGFSVMGSALYAKGGLSLGTLMAIYLSTSDEAIPVILAQPDKVGIVFPLIFTKICIGTTAGYLIDLAYSRKRLPVETSEEEKARQKSGKACCDHHVTSHDGFRARLIHPIIHTLKVFLFILLVTFVINIVIFQTGGEEKLAQLFQGHFFLQTILTGLVGLIPNCAASVAITQIYLSGGISYGSAIAGLCSSAGVGILVLFRELNNWRDSMKIIGLLCGISIAAGIVIDVVMP